MSNATEFLTVAGQSLAEMRDLVRRLHDVELRDVEDPRPHGGGLVPVASVPEGRKLQSLRPLLDEYLERPARIKGTARMTELDSFIAHVVRQKVASSALFARAEMANPLLAAVFDYHQGADEQAESSGLADWCGHKAHYDFSLSDEWKIWTAQDGEAMAQGDFAAFLEDHIVDVLFHHDDESLSAEHRQFRDALGGVVAGPSTLIGLSRGLKINEAVAVQNAVNLSSGETALTYTSEHRSEAGEKLVVPNLFIIGIPVVLGGPLYKIAVRLRYRLKGGALSWYYQLWRPEKVFDHAFREACEKAARETGLPLFYGVPECGF